MVLEGDAMAELRKSFLQKEREEADGLELSEFVATMLPLVRKRRKQLREEAEAKVRRVQ